MFTFNFYLTNFQLTLVVQLKYHDSGREAKVDPRVGQWNMIDKVKYPIFVCMFKYKVARKSADFHVCFNYFIPYGSLDIKKHKDYLGSDLVLLLPKSYPIIRVDCVSNMHSSQGLKIVHIFVPAANSHLVGITLFFVILFF